MKIKIQPEPPAKILWNIVPSAAGKLVVGVTEKGWLCRVSFLRDRDAIDVVHGWEMEWKRTSFMRGKLPKDVMKLPLLMVGTQFQGKTWKEIMQIPKGSVASYGEIAYRINEPRAARAVGTACGKNNLAYIIPCHRVVSANGIGGYGPAGIDVKKSLLKAEGCRV